MRPMLEARALQTLSTRINRRRRRRQGVLLGPPGEIALIIGLSGSGKSTLLSMLGCILRPTGAAFGAVLSRIDPPPGS